MLVYRVFGHDPHAPAGEPGHEDFVYRPAQGASRLDNASSYVTWYYGFTPEVAVGEAFGDLAQWSDDMFETPWLPTGRRVLGTFEIPDATPLLDLDDAANLVERSLRPTQVVTRVRSTSQSWALNIFREQRNGGRRWDGVRWWSYHRPQWTVFGIWTVDPDPPLHRLVKVERLARTHPAVASAQGTLAKLWH
ncbi:RES domain-containing protein [Rathayibacter sp. VKM Ac-2759]|uniref:RES domain-containing protein n=1 Tax=Rathayibacter sp. VKM Ac-2759 TaxID=2609252 RepID=UPI0013166C96|nr:RES domain-containing protein [Rathayibacter sp. VKM Ac-2759]QHC65415.1 RES domain-containing protein [Rathayibacter sp. VKM Ac-2759]